MNNIKNTFNIRDLENLTGIKAHTIRIWEKRYKILEPMRTDTNIRFYDVASLQKLLNISTLNSFGYKISALAKMPQEKIPVLVKEVLSNKSLNNHVLNNFKLAMMNFDQSLFLNTYNSLLQEKSFREIFYEFFIPLLDEIGYLWQTNTITPAHEHFISFLIKQKLASNIEKLLLQPSYKNDRIFVLYLPENEIHELGLMFLNYELALNGFRCIYLGESVPIDNLKDVKNYFDDITFITYCTVEPGMEEINDYINTLKNELLDETTNLYIFGHNSQYLNKSIVNNKIRIYSSIKDFTDIF
ncbi:MerR family transcriptional regulator [Flavobacterium sp. MK4S-17]|uniref:MerR family transcriptional regulator n=1 Tax=Flavobacterium sp. MK4S-17 TaxID=2543737 RepID=UPI00135B79F8|nr:MerR family transcriptional regulator [Flavobacterium sp. MK4S-17]